MDFGFILDVIGCLVLYTCNWEDTTVKMESLPVVFYDVGIFQASNHFQFEEV